jgi:hypothetical protein
VPENHFGERVAERYDEECADLFEPALVDPVVDFLAALAGGRRRARARHRYGAGSLAAARRGVPVDGGRLPRLQHDQEPDNAGENYFAQIRRAE